MFSICLWPVKSGLSEVPFNMASVLNDKPGSAIGQNFQINSAKWPLSIPWAEACYAKDGVSGLPRNPGERGGAVILTPQPELLHQHILHQMWLLFLKLWLLSYTVLIFFFWSISLFPLLGKNVRLKKWFNNPNCIFTFWVGVNRIMRESWVLSWRSLFFLGFEVWGCYFDFLSLKIFET